MEDRTGGRPNSLRHNRASKAAAREERFCSNPSRVIGAGDGWSTKVGGSLVLTTEGIGFVS